MQTSMKKGRTLEVFKEKENVKVKTKYSGFQMRDAIFSLSVGPIWVLFPSISKLEGNQKNIFYWLTNCK